MLDDFPHLRLAIGEREIAVHERAWRRVRVLARAPLAQPATAPGILAALEDLLRDLPSKRRRARAILHDGLVRYWRCETPAGASLPADLLAAARMRFEATFDEPADGWQVRISPGARDVLACCAVPRAFVDPLVAMLAARDICLTSVVPRMPALWNHWRPALSRGSWLVAAGPGGTQLAAGTGGRLHAVRQLQVGSMDAPRAWAIELRREAQLLGMEVPPALAWCGPAALPPPAGVGVQWTYLGAIADAVDLCGGVP